MLDTVEDYWWQARVLLQDTIETYRYPDEDLIEALNYGIMTARRDRPDLFLSVTSVPQFTTADINNATAFAMDVQYRVPFLFFMTGWIQLRDEEDTQDARAAAFISKFTQQLMTIS